VRWVVSIALTVWAATAAAQSLWIEVDLSEQQMIVRDTQGPLFKWPVSTARSGKCTPVGVYTPYLLKRRHFSTLYDGAPMPHSIFFSGNYAIHGTTQVDRLGEPASAGCIRLAPENAEVLFERLLEVGKEDTRVVIKE